jgi:hypothetical protein
MARSVSESSNSDNAISLSGNATVFLTATSTDIQTGVNITGGSITGMGNPAANTDVANKSYVDTTFATAPTIGDVLALSIALG